MENGEVVCTKCGMVLGPILEYARAHSEGRQSLYHRAVLGGDSKDARGLKQYIHIDNTRDLSDFSNLCDKLHLPNFVTHEAWNIYVKSRGLKCCTRATCALYAVYNACRYSGCGVSEERIREAIPLALGVKNIRTVVKALFTLNGVMGEIGAARKSTFYYLNVAVASMQNRFIRMEDFNTFRRLAQTHYRNLSGNDRSRAKRAVATALSETRPRLRQ